ncbi:hypothetical protein GCM10009651_32570 [Microbacterium natoriense]|uniref:hypothetical protein n=1 Tax=Microbacterium natoriense TaxID=284570 RepID=UPI0031DE2D94
MQLGSFADIVTALTAVGALIAAILGARHAARLLDMEGKRDAAAAAREMQSQASTVFAWVASRIGDDATTFGAVVANSSEQAIYDVEVRVTDAYGKERRPIVLTVLPLVLTTSERATRRTGGSSRLGCARSTMRSVLSRSRRSDASSV